MPKGLLAQIDHIAECEFRNRSDLIRESLRLYIQSFRLNHTKHIQKPKEEVLLPSPNIIAQGE